jgi:hypothetical protein
VITLDRHVKIAADLSRRIFDQVKSLQPMIHAITKDDEHLIAAVPQVGGDDDEKDAAAVGLHAFLKEKNVVQYVLLTEAWVLTLPAGTNIGGDLPRPKDHPDRVEVITLSGETKDRAIHGMITITRDANGNPTLGELETWDGGMSTGRLTGLLKTAQ